MSVTVLIVNYKVYDALSTCLETLAADPEAARADVIVLDNESDETRLAAALARHPRAIGIPSGENRGFAAGMNEAASHATADLLLLLNPDTRVMPGAIERLTSFLLSHPAVVAVGPKVIYPDGSVQATGRTFPTALTGLFGRKSFLTKVFPGNPMSRHNLPSADAGTAIEVDWVTGTCMMIRAQAFHAVGGFDERFFLYWEDADLCQRLRQRGGTVAFLPSAVVEHSAEKSSDHARVRSLIAFHCSALRYYGRYSRGPSRVVALPFAAVALTARLCLKLAVLSWRR